MSELNKKLAEWRWPNAQVYIPRVGGEIRVRIDGQTTQYDLFTNDLNACFEHLEPELYRRGLRYQLTRLQDGHRAMIFAPSKAWAHIVADAVAEKPATAFCKAVEILMEKQCES